MEDFSPPAFSPNGSSSGFPNVALEYVAELEDVFEDAKTRKKRLQLEMNSSLKVLHIKPATFCNLVMAENEEEMKEYISKKAYIGHFLPHEIFVS